MSMAQVLGIELGLPVAPLFFALAHFAAFTMIMWTISANIFVKSDDHNDVGVGIALLVIAGISFANPLNFLIAFFALILICEGTDQSGEVNEESPENEPFLSGAIPEETWNQYLEQIVSSITTRRKVLIQTEQLMNRNGVTHCFFSNDPQFTFFMSLNRKNGALRYIEIACGSIREDIQGFGAPDLTLTPRKQPDIIGATHPSPPFSKAATYIMGYDSFDDRFVVRDEKNYRKMLVTPSNDGDSMDQALMYLYGWLAYWNQVGIRYRVFPGQGVPLDFPVPISELAFTEVRDDSSDPLMELLDYLHQCCRRAP